MQIIILSGQIVWENVSQSVVSASGGKPLALPEFSGKDWMFFCNSVRGKLSAIPPPFPKSYPLFIHILLHIVTVIEPYYTISVYDIEKVSYMRMMVYIYYFCICYPLFSLLYYATKNKDVM